MSDLYQNSTNRINNRSGSAHRSINEISSENNHFRLRSGDWLIQSAKKQESRSLLSGGSSPIISRRNLSVPGSMGRSSNINRYASYIVTTRRSIYTYGGITTGGELQHEILKGVPETGTGTKFVNISLHLPFCPRVGATIGFLRSEYLFVHGGINRLGELLDDLWVHDGRKNLWSHVTTIEVNNEGHVLRKSGIKAAFHTFVTSASSKKGYFIGGKLGSPDFAIYVLHLNTFVSGSEIRYECISREMFVGDRDLFKSGNELIGHNAVYYNGYIYIYGGMGGGAVIEDRSPCVWRVATNTWEISRIDIYNDSDEPHPNSLRGRVYAASYMLPSQSLWVIAGGRDENNELGSLFALNLRSRRYVYKDGFAGFSGAVISVDLKGGQGDAEIDIWCGTHRSIYISHILPTTKSKHKDEEDVSSFLNIGDLGEYRGNAFNSVYSIDRRGSHDFMTIGRGISDDATWSPAHGHSSPPSKLSSIGEDTEIAGDEANMVGDPVYEGEPLTTGMRGPRSEPNSTDGGDNERNQSVSSSVQGRNISTGSTVGFGGAEGGVVHSKPVILDATGDILGDEPAKDTMEGPAHALEGCGFDTPGEECHTLASGLSREGDDEAWMVGGVVSESEGVVGKGLILTGLDQLARSATDNKETSACECCNQEAYTPRGRVPRPVVATPMGSHTRNAQSHICKSILTSGSSLDQKFRDVLVRRSQLERGVTEGSTPLASCTGEVDAIDSYKHENGGVVVEGANLEPRFIDNCTNTTNASMSDVGINTYKVDLCTIGVNTKSTREVASIDAGVNTTSYVSVDKETVTEPRCMVDTGTTAQQIDVVHVGVATEFVGGGTVAIGVGTEPLDDNARRPVGDVGIGTDTVSLEDGSKTVVLYDTYTDVVLRVMVDRSNVIDALNSAADAERSKTQQTKDNNETAKDLNEKISHYKDLYKKLKHTANLYKSENNKLVSALNDIIGRLTESDAKGAIKIIKTVRDQIKELRAKAISK